MLLNAAHACLLRGAFRDASWACDEAFAAAAPLPHGSALGDALRAKALYRRAKAGAAEGTTESLEAAARDAAQAAALAPRDAKARACAPMGAGAAVF